ncbi:hypothetical protein [Streptomyces sp. HUAS TT7]|uniref:hypothetical protein n=1 Tax=Streptomyces sp. HUAS TT7 TaxID=3447507 RepID=UPI003F65BB56
MRAHMEELLRDALENVASAGPDGSRQSYRKEQARWRRREYRRRCVVALLVFLIVGAVRTIGLLELSGASPDNHVIFYNGDTGTTGGGSRPLGR